MRRRNLVISSDSDEEDDGATIASVSAATGGGGSVDRPSSQNPSQVPYPLPSSAPPSPPVEISDDEEEVDEIEDPDEDYPFVDVAYEMQDSDVEDTFVDVPDDLSPPAPVPPQHPPGRTSPSAPVPASAPPFRTPTPTPPPAPAPAPAPPFRTPTPTPPPAPAPAPAPPFRTPTPTPPPAPAPASAPPFQTPTPPASAPPFRTPTPTPAAPPFPTPTPTPPLAPPSAPLGRTPTPTPPSAPAFSPMARTPTPTPPSGAAPALRGRTATPTPPPAWTPTPTPLTASTPPSALSARLRPVDAFLRRLGLRVRPEWLELCATEIPEFNGSSGTEVLARRCFEQFLFADMNACGAGVLPQGIRSMNAAILDGPFVLQVDEIVNISAPLRERYHGANAGPKRCLKLSMTDGSQRIYGMEYRPIKDLEVLTPAGFKIIIRNVHIRRGLLMLVPEVIEILGGVVDELEAARDRLVSEVNKPPRGKRKQGGLLLSTRATQAAWRCNISITNGSEQGVSVPRTVNPSNTTAGLVNVLQQNQHSQEFSMQDRSTSLTRNDVGVSAPATYRYEPQPSISRTTSTLAEGYLEHPIVSNSVHEQMQRVQEITMQDRGAASTRNRGEPSASTPCGNGSQQGPHGTGTSSNGAARSSNVDNKIERPVILSGENEKPFTYAFNMMSDWLIEQDTRPYIRGKIKGFITSVKRFQYKQCKEYELIVFIEDGSHISEALVDSAILENITGYTSEEATVTLLDASSASAIALKQIMIGFQQYLVKFEGTMLIEFNKTSSIPIVREMNEGCSSSDPWLLLQRVKTFSDQRHIRSLDFMDITS
ncbi:hypothetical protein BRADI_5g08320v3 [Brachypodium distachyon]|uniref:RecQ-mediated genome instability protein 1 n=1 Tax=Brachypodium distachyon TaxID=15368 RepID=A0A2K2CFW9_BRADI|nr:hypothetical protein BRADI_5g08320v3 [Brachypodium distachyon]